ncbi:peamaclein-like [Hibiscus syriacus]|nr:peamaclein-like [Hibiscus syriacus]
MKPVLLTFLLVSLILISSLFEVSMAGSCSSKCKTRCSKAGVKGRCLKNCGICCNKCKCVPSGTYGNKHECPCYRDFKNSKGKPKCP